MFDFLKRKKAECVVIGESYEYPYVDGVAVEGCTGWEVMRDNSVCYRWNRRTGEFSIGYGIGGEMTHAAKPMIVVSTEARAKQLFRFLNRLHLLQQAVNCHNVVNGRFKHLFVCVKNPLVELFVNELFDSKSDKVCKSLFGAYQKYRKKVHVIPYSVCVACEDTHRVESNS